MVSLIDFFFFFYQPGIFSTVMKQALKLQNITVCNIQVTVLTQ